MAIKRVGVRYKDFDGNEKFEDYFCESYCTDFFITFDFFDRVKNKNIDFTSIELYSYETNTYTRTGHQYSMV